jgi:hypothetical protein
MLGGHPQHGCRKLKHHTTFCVQQQSRGNTCGFYIFLNMVAFGAQLNYDVSVSVFILLYCRRFAHSPFANTYFSFYHCRATKILLLMSKVLASNILERG